MYKEYWQLTKKPFENTVDPTFFYYSPEHKEALSRMVYVVREHKTGFFLTGNYGMGKTLLSRALIKQCPAEQFRFAVLTNPKLTSLELIKEINYQLGSLNDSFKLSSKVELLHSLSEILNDNYNKGVYSVIIVDEAQSIDGESLLEELRLLLNIQREESILFSLLLLGQLPLLEKIDKIPQLKQRLSIRYHLHPLNRDETQEYIQHRLNVAGVNKRIFTDSAFAEVYSLSGGIPRAINNICDLALLSGFIKHLDLIDKDIITQVGKDLESNLAQEVKEEND